MQVRKRLLRQLSDTGRADMNSEWSELNKEMQVQLKKRESFDEGRQTLFRLRKSLYEVLADMAEALTEGDLCAMPFPNAKGYHSKTIAYSIWHIARIEDITAHSLIKGDSQIFFSENYDRRTGSPIITTGNELSGDGIAEFSRKLDRGELMSYFTDVKNSTEKIIGDLDFSGLKRKFTEKERGYLVSLSCVSEDENAAWLIDYWCGKDVGGLIRMPFSRHWIMHTEAAVRIRDKLA